MKKNHSEYIFAQNIIADLVNVSPSTVTRAVKELNLKSVSPESAKVKKYSLEDTRRLARRLSPYSGLSKKVHVFYNLKGGTGKTSVCAQISSHLSILGYNVLVIDCDPQAHMTSILGFPENGDYLTMYDILIGGINEKEAIQNVMPGLDAILSNLSLSRLEVPLSQKPRREEKLLSIINRISPNYDFVMIDTNPSFSTLNLNALFCADQVNFICETAPFSLYGLRVMLEETINFFEEMKKELNYKIIPNKYESKTATAQEVLGYLRANYKGNVMEAVIRKCEDINIASKDCKPISAFCKKSSIAFEDIRDILQEFLSSSERKSEELKFG